MSVEQHHTGVAWAHCPRGGWDGPIRTSTVRARDDERTHVCVQLDDDERAEKGEGR